MLVPIIQLTFCVLIFYASRSETDREKAALRKSFYLLASAISLWCLGQYAYDLSLNIDFLQIVSRFGIVTTIWVAFFFALFARKIVNKDTQNIFHFDVALGVFATLVGLGIEIVNISVENGEVVYGYNYILYTFITAVPLYFIFKAIYSLEKYAKSSRLRIDRRRALFVSRGMIITTLFAVTGNYVFTLIGGSTTFLIDILVVIAPLSYTVSVGYVVFSLKLFNFRKFFRQVILYSAAISALFITVSIIAVAIISEYRTEFTAIEILISLIIGGVLYVVAAAIIRISSRRILGANQLNDQDIERSLQAVLKTTDTDKLVQGVLDVIMSRYGIEKSKLLLVDIDEEGDIKQYPLYKKISTIDYSALKTLLAKDDIDETFTNNELRKIGLKNYGYGYILRRGAISGILAVGDKLNGRPFYSDELFDLRKTANELALALENTQQYYRIRQFNEELEEKITLATGQLRRTNDKLKALDETKDEFISMASHQLRTPLTSVKGYISMVLEGDAGPLNEQQDKLLTQAFISSQRMVYLIADLLNVSRLRTGKFVIERTEVSLPDIVSGELDQLHEAAKAKGLELTFDPPKDFPTISLDETKIRQVIMNFIDNAMYYTMAGGKIKLELEANRSSVEFRVVDNGVGVPKEEQHHMFTKFYRANNARRMRPDGTGLGLFMAKKVIIAQGGAIVFKSVEGKGSTFGFTFPRNKLEVGSAKS